MYVLQQIHIFHDGQWPFRVKAILRQVHQMATKMTLNTQRSKVSHTGFTGTIKSQISIRFLYDHPFFELLDILRRVHKNNPKMTLNIKRWKVPHMYPTTTPES